MAIENHPNYATINTFIQSLITKIQNKQAEYFTQKGKFFQGLRIPSQGKIDGSVLATIDPALHPDDQSDSWKTFDSDNFKVTTKIPVHIKVDVYKSPQGWGWILSIEFWKVGLGPDRYGNDGDHWVFQHNEGPELRQGIWDDWFISQELNK